MVIMLEWGAFCVALHNLWLELWLNFCPLLKRTCLCGPKRFCRRNNRSSHKFLLVATFTSGVADANTQVCLSAFSLSRSSTSRWWKGNCWQVVDLSQK